MKKLFLGLFATICLGIGVACSVPITYGARAEEEIVEVVDSTGVVESTGVVDENEIGNVATTLSQEAQDIIAVVKEICSQPIVVGGVSTTIGAFVVYVIFKLINGAMSKKKIKALMSKITQLGVEMTESVKLKDYLLLKKQYDNLLNILYEIAPTIKNVNVRENVLLLLNEVKSKAVDPTVEFAKTETERVVSDSKDYVNSKALEIADIINQD